MAVLPCSVDFYNLDGSWKVPVLQPQNRIFRQGKQRRKNKYTGRHEPVVNRNGNANAQFLSQGRQGQRLTKTIRYRGKKRWQVVEMQG